MEGRLAEKRTKEQQSTDAAPEARTSRSAVPLRGGRDLWQIPTLLAGLGLLLVGLAMWMREAPGPDFPGALGRVESLFEAQEYAQALAELNGPILSALNHPDATTEIVARFYALRGDGLYLAQRAGQMDVRENHLAILNEYKSAEGLMPAIIDGRRSAFIADTLISLGRLQEAEVRIATIPDEDAARRHELTKVLVRRELYSSVPNFDRAETLLARMKQDTTLAEVDRQWVIARQNEVRLSRGRSDRVIDDLLVEIQRLPDRRTPQAAELFLILGRAYLDQGQMDAAQTQLQRAEEGLSVGVPLLGEVQVALGRIAQAKGDLEEARDRFVLVTDQYRGTAAVGEAFLGFAETSADLGRPEESIAAYEELVKLVRGEQAGGVTAAMAEVSLGQRHRERFMNADYRTALRFAELGPLLFPDDVIPPDTVLRVADTHRRLASQLLSIDPDLPITEVELEDADPVTVEEARVHYQRAGAAYQRHARMVILEDSEHAGDSQWFAADCYDRAGDQEAAIRLFTDFVQTQPKDARLVEAKFRLGRALQVRGEFRAAIDLFEQIISANPTSTTAAKCYIPLAQCYLHSEDPASHARAERRLLEVLSGKDFQPDAVQFSDALFELGRLYRRIGRYVDAIERLDESLRRYPDTPLRTELRFHLADSHRLSAAEILTRLEEAMPTSERATLETLREERLREALRLYEDIRSDLESKDPRRLTHLEQSILRNALFYRGDCAFDLEDYDTAIRYYDTAAQRFAQEPASLVAMVQIVNCYTAQGKWREASTAHDRARARLESLPPNVWDTAHAPMDRRHWERWLDASERLDQQRAAVGEP